MSSLLSIHAFCTSARIAFLNVEASISYVLSKYWDMISRHCVGGIVIFVVPLLCACCSVASCVAPVSALKYVHRTRLLLLSDHIV